MSKLHGTGSIQPGLGMSSLLSEVARNREVDVTDQTRAGWRAVNDLVQHLDNRVDGDYPGSGKPSGESATEPLRIDSYIEYLTAEDPEFPSDDGHLLPEQRAAFIAVRRHFSSFDFKDGTAQAFGVVLRHWLAASNEAKQATSVDDYIHWRRREGEELGHLFALSVPPSARKEHFGSFVYRVVELGKIAKLFDSVIDLKRDRQTGNVDASLPRTARFGAAALAAHDSLMFVLANPYLARPLGRKALAYFHNRTGSLNAERTHD